MALGLSLVQPGQVGFSQYLPLDGWHQLLCGQAGFKMQCPAQSIQPENIMMRSAGRARATVSDPAPAVAPLTAAVWQFIKWWNILRQPAVCRRYIVNNPVGPGPTGGVRIIHHQRKLECSGRGIAPQKRW